MKWLFWLSVAAVVYGSLFPLIYQPVADFGAEFGTMLARWGTRHTSDILANIALFVPYGLFGRFAGYRLRWLMPAGVLLAFVLQVGQIVVFARDPALGDVL
ncbi:MAG: hypothetical protein R3360_04495, partial [Alphaproteobacteria bacterium]|nr:hypothetical protein [Alphaproteobacteria bacterium]